MQQSDFESSTPSTSSNGPLDLSGDATVSQIAMALNQGDHESAGSLLREALADSPNDTQLLRLAAKQRRQAERFTRVYSLLKETAEAFESDEFVRAVGAYREAANLSLGFSDLEKATFQAGIDQASELGPRNWRIARALLEDAERLNPELVVPEQRWKDVKAAEREETIANVLEETALAKPADLGRARERLMRTLEQYPEDTGLANRLKSIESTIEDKRKWDERQKCLKKLADLRNAMQREEDPAQLGKYVTQSEALAAAYSAEPEFSNVVEDIRHQVTSGEKAAAALKQDRIEDCLEECAWVLSRMRHHQVFLNLKKQAEERELSLADEYSNSVARIKELLAAGKLAEADALCSKASAELPQFADLRELKKEIEERRSKEDPALQQNADNVRRLLERGERQLREQQYRLAEQSFGSALKLRPDDKKLSGHVMGLLHGFARSAMRDNPQSAEEALQLLGRLLPGTAVPADLAAAVRQKRRQAQDESVRLTALDKLGSLDAQVESAQKREELAAVRDEAASANFAAAPHPDVKQAANALFLKIDGKTADFDRTQARRPALYRAVSIAAMLLLGVGLAYWLNNNHSPSPAPVPEKPKVVETAAVAPPASVIASTPAPAPPPEPSVPNTGSLIVRSEVPGVRIAIGDRQYTLSNRPLKVELNADSYQVRGSRAGYKDFGPVTVDVGKAAETVLDVKLTPQPASLEIRGVAPDMRIKVDGVLLGRATAHTAIAKELPPGQHSIEVSRNGFLPRTFTRNLAPGETLLLAGSDLRLESADTRALAAVPAPAPKMDELQWQSIDKNNPDALRTFVSQYPNSTHANQAKQQMETVLVAREDGDWNNTDRNSRAALEDFLKRHPDGRHASVASSSLADVERKARLAEKENTEEAVWKRVNRRDEAALASFLRDNPASRYRNQAEADLANIRLSKSSNESAAVLTVISRLANAWSARDLDSILAIQRNLNKREVKAELSHVKELEMQISPASPPQIDGTQAVVLCRRQASQLFSDGTRKRIPESIVSFVLVKHDGNWTIEGTK